MSISFVVALISLVLIFDPIHSLVTKRGGEHHKPLVEWLKIIALAIVAVLPYIDSRISAKELEEANRTASIAQSQAEEANLRAQNLEAANAPRQISQANVATLVSAIQLYPLTKVSVSCKMGDPEAQPFCHSLANVLTYGGWKIVEYSPYTEEAGPDSLDPIAITYDPSMSAPASSIISALNALGLKAIGHVIERGAKAKSIIDIWVGPKS